MTDAELARNTEILLTQWSRLRSWLDELDDLTDPRPSVLPAWTVGELIAHLGRSLGALTGSVDATAGVNPRSIAEYLSGYPANAAAIAAGTRDLARDIADDPLTGIDELAAEAFEHLTAFGTHDLVVQARRGPVLLSDLVLTRTIELVVHADDLARSIPGATAPIDRAALDQVADALLEIVITRGGWSLVVREPLAWIRLACGREPYDVDRLAEALEPTYTSDSVPDLGTYLPVL